MTNSCESCPSYADPAGFSMAFPNHTPPGVPICMRFGRVLTGDRDLKVQAKVLEAVAGQCASYGQPVPDQLPEWMPDFPKVGDNPTALARLARTVQLAVDRPDTCFGCQYFNPSGDVTQFDTGLCHAQGSLVLTSGRDAARKCGTGERFGLSGSNYSFNELEISLFPDMGLPIPADPYSTGVPVIDVPKAVVEPTTCPSDYPVDPADQKEGIRAWRKITDPKNPKRSVLMPVFDPAYFNEDERAKIPQTGDDEHPELYIDYSESIYKVLVLWLELDETPAVWGQAGVGKTELFRHLAWLMQLPFERISITATSEVDDLAGKMLFSPEVGTHFQYGRIPKSWTKPCVIDLDEPNVGPAEVWEFLRPLTDNSKQLVLDVHAGERIERHKFCYMGMAMNPAWDPRNIGAESVSDADSSRLMHIFIDNPPHNIEARILQDRLKLDGWQLSDVSLTQVMMLAADLRKLSNDGMLPITWGIRHQIKAVRALKWFTPVNAYRIACADFLEPTHQAIVLDLVKATVEEVQ